MSHEWDEFTKSLVEESVSRRDSLRRLGFALVGTVFGSLGAPAAWAARRTSRTTDPCKTFCKCRNKQQQDQCLKACNACGKNPKRMGGRCGSYFCCAVGQTPCGNYCSDLAGDFYNCGACGNVCDDARPNEYGLCVNGGCEYGCAEGAVDCGGSCTFLDWDASNCGACGNVCPPAAPYCNQGACSACASGLALCGSACADLANDPDNCGACGNVCGGPSPFCYQGACSTCVPYCPDLWCGGDGCGGACGCPSGMYCESNGWCYGGCTPDSPYYPNC